MKLFETIGNNILGTEFVVKAQRDGITIIHVQGEYAIVIGFLSYPGVVQVRENAVVMKCFKPIEDIVGPILKRNEMSFKSYGGYQATIQQVLILKDLLSIDYSSLGDRKDLAINDENSIRNFFVAMKKLVAYAQINFVSKYATLVDVFESSDRMTPQERGEFFAAPAPLRKIVVDYYCDKDFDFVSRFDELVKELQSAEVAYPSVFKNQAQATRKVAEYIQMNIKKS